MGLKALRIRFDELYRCKIYDGIRYLAVWFWTIGYNL